VCFARIRVSILLELYADDQLKIIHSRVKPGGPRKKLYSPPENWRVT
jgi:hypothetical protein